MISESFINNVAFSNFEILRVGRVHSWKMPRGTELKLILYLKISTSSMWTNVLLLKVDTCKSSILFPRYRK